MNIIDINTDLIKQPTVIAAIVVPTLIMGFVNPWCALTYLVIMLGFLMRNPFIKASLIIGGMVGSCFALFPEVFDTLGTGKFLLPIVACIAGFLWMFYVTYDEMMGMQTNKYLHILHEAAIMLFLTIAIALGILMLWGTLRLGEYTTYLFCAVGVISCYVSGWFISKNSVSLGLFNAGGIILWLGMVARGMGRGTMTPPPPPNLLDKLLVPIFKTFNQLGGPFALIGIICIFLLPGLALFALKKYLKK